MKITAFEIHFENDGEHYAAVFHKDNKGGVIVEPFKRNKWISLMNASPSAVINHLYQIGVPTAIFRDLIKRTGLDNTR